ncbi:MAG: hypothetical protein LH629_13075 [Ignavibacteria bacterium]|nr:hypothetical protein [Ignavibacteria bacterium]
MKVRKIVYKIDYIHILTFREFYKSIIAPYFIYEPLEYGIDNENTLNEGARLVFRNEGFIINLRKEGIILIFEGDISEVKKSNPIIDMYFEIYEKIKKIDGFAKTKRHSLSLDSVMFLQKEEIERLLVKNNYLVNPFGEITEFATVFNFEKKDKKYRLQFGNYSGKDIKQFDLSPLQTEYNKELNSKFGLMCNLNIVEEIGNPSFSKFKLLIKDGEDVVENYLKVGDE